MTDRKRLVATLWLASSLALLAPVLVGPIQTSGLLTVASPPHSVRRIFALSPGQPVIRDSAGTATDAILEVTALPSENEEQDPADPLDGPRVSYLIPSSFGNVPDRHLIAPPSILSLFPLRC
jgi:hypothetical protein